MWHHLGTHVILHGKWIFQVKFTNKLIEDREFPPLICGPNVISSVQLLSHIQLLVGLWTSAFQASLSNNNCLSLLKLMSIKSVMPSKHLILSSPSPAFNPLQHQGLFQWVHSSSSGQSIGASASASGLPAKTQDWFPLGLTSLISLQFKEFSRVFSNTTVQNHQFCALLFCGPTLTSIHHYRKNHSFD